MEVWQTEFKTGKIRNRGTKANKPIHPPFLVLDLTPSVLWYSWLGCSHQQIYGLPSVLEAQRFKFKDSETWRRCCLTAVLLPHCSVASQLLPFSCQQAGLFVHLTQITFLQQLKLNSVACINCVNWTNALPSFYLSPLVCHSHGEGQWAMQGTEG